MKYLIFPDYNHLLEKKAYAEIIINNLKNEKEKLKIIIMEETEVNQSFLICEKLQNDIKNYKNVTDSCLKTCSQLTTQIIQLKKDLEKYNYTNANNAPNVNSSYINNSYISINNSRLSNSLSKKNSQSNIKKSK